MLIHGVKESPYLRLHAQQIEIVAGDRIAVDVHRRVTPAQSRNGISIYPGHPAEAGVSLPKILKCGIRRSQQPSKRPLFMAKLIQVLWVADIERVQQDLIQHSEDDDVGPNPQHQS